MIDTIKQYLNMNKPEFKDKTSQSIDGSNQRIHFYFIKLIILSFKFVYQFK